MNDQEKQDLNEALTLARNNARVLVDLEKMMDEYYHTNFPDRQIFEKKVVFNEEVLFMLALIFTNNVTFNGTITFEDGSTLNLGATTGGKIGATGDKVGFLGATPLPQQGAITKPTAPSVAYDQTEAASMKTAVDAIIDYLKNFGFTA